MIDATMTQRMEEATRLTRAGKLHEAMAILQGTQPGATAEQQPQHAHRTGDTFEGSCRVIDDAVSGSGSASGESAARSDQARGATKRAGPGTFTSGRFSNTAGTRDYKLYIPSGYHGQARPLVVMLHGCTQDPDDFAAGTNMNRLAEEQLFCVLYPAQPLTANSSKCWNWFKAQDQQREGGEPAILAGMARQVIATHGLDAGRVYVAGLSAGGAMATTLAMTYPDLFAAVGVHSGLPHGVAQSLPDALGAMQGGKSPLGGAGAARASGWASDVPVIIFHGDRDPTVHPSNADRVAAQYAASRRTGDSANRHEGARVTVERGQVVNGHGYVRTTHHDAKGTPRLEHWRIEGAGHAWSGGSERGSHTDPKGPDATREMLRFFRLHHHRLHHRNEANPA
ncbi:alpha/beta hydrolase family esterase [Halomonas urumqiensis]|uniref:Plasmid partitioning protein n=1 Tax=Halomonas urumqiensis TaxID=1684789 RepID=A0A2N7UFS8_9GAMM|nr:PHB depolymerase family esterase [Halomonas urumqiensis]PMR79307.1 plasmid partitioning protein [Halomonas urumqiensis]PTB03981.1 plasmid partitioning protein [Halomonas urumqiensis]GHE19761.1 esterase [Halomonas urumqiensis]